MVRASFNQEVCRPRGSVSDASLRSHGLIQAMRPLVTVHLLVLEFEADTRGGGEVGLVEEAVGEPVLHAGVEGAEVAIEALGKAIVGHQRDGILCAAAG